MRQTRQKGEAGADAPAPFHFTASGLSNVWLLNGFTIEKTPYGNGVRIEDLDGLHKALAHAIVTAKAAFTGEELRFLRKYLQLSQAGLGRLLGLSDQSIARWEKGQGAIDPSAERLVRMVVRERLGEDADWIEALNELAELDEATHGRLELRRDGAAWREAA
jgi:DNA-binding transcriptional regulator YiaG